MMRPMAGLVAGVLYACGFAVVPCAAAEPTVVTVSLTDMSSGAGQAPGPGMMRPATNAHATMAVRASPDSIKAGPVRFVVTNRSRSLPHEMLVIATGNPRAPLPYDPAQARVMEDKVRLLADSEDLKPGTSRTVTLALPPGSYLLICNVPGHYAAGMVTQLTVTR